MPRKGTGDYRMRFRLLGVMALALFWALSAAAQVDVDRFLKRDTYGQVKISPSGDYYAATIELPDREVLVIARRSDGKFTAKATGGPHSAVADFWWVNDDRVVIAMAQKFGALDRPQAIGELHGITCPTTWFCDLIVHGRPPCWKFTVVVKPRLFQVACAAVDEVPAKSGTVQVATVTEIMFGTLLNAVVPPA